MHKVYWTGRQLHELPKTRLYYDLTLLGFGAPYSYGIMIDIVRGRAILARAEKKKKLKAAREEEEAKRMKAERVEQWVRQKGKGACRTSVYDVRDNDEYYPWPMFRNFIIKPVTLFSILVVLFDLLVFVFDKLIFLFNM